MNHAGAPIDVFWIDTFKNDGTVVKQTSKPIRNGTETNINSYDGHDFVAKFVDEKPGVLEAYFTKGPSEEKVIISYDEEAKAMDAQQITKFNEIMDLVKEAEVICGSLKGEAFSDCISSKMLEEVQRLNDTTREIKKFRDIMAPQLYDYVCADDKVNFTEPIKTSSLTVDKQSYSIKEMVDTDMAKIFVVQNAISSRECQALETGSSATSTAGVITDAVGNSEVASTSRETDKAATYSFDDEFPDQDELWPLYNRLHSMVNKHAKHDIRPAGQEPFTFHTFLSGDDNLPRGCDGNCSHEYPTHQRGGRIATAIVFCKVPQRGGILMFPKSDVILQPTARSAVIFTYKHAELNVMDDGYTDYAMCPVNTGELKMGTLRMRQGVSDNSPWSTFVQPAVASSGSSSSD